MGRHTKLTREAGDRFLAAIRAGVFPEVAARHAGFSPASMYRYMRGSQPEQLEFREQVQEALAALEIRLTGTIVQDALTDSRWALVLLERRFPERWRVRDRPASDGPDDDSKAGRPPESTVPLDRAFLDELVPKLLEAGRRPPNGGQADPDRLAGFVHDAPADRPDSDE